MLISSSSNAGDANRISEYGPAMSRIFGLSSFLRESFKSSSKIPDFSEMRRSSLSVGLKQSAQTKFAGLDKSSNVPSSIWSLTYLRTFIICVFKI